ncbi:MAG: HAD-IIA family hydrolase [Chloroflexota bacterium]|jgi:4-nitrophenyl phosphatase|nr:HAD-IIA family hydrolase [Chloroflexota bacterium]
MISEHFNNIKGLIIDMDGVLWHDHQPLGDLPKIFNRIDDLGLRSILATNNASRTVEEYHQKLAGFGVKLEDWQVINSAQAAGIYLSEQYPNGCNVYVVGSPSLKETLESYDLRVVSEAEDDVQVVVASMDLELNYEKLKHATLLIRSGCEFIGTNPDATFPTPEGLLPGSGMVVGALEIASGQQAKIMGKPKPLLYEMALKRLELAPEETLAIGDRLETDIAGAQAVGMHTALVLTGASTLAQAQDFDPPPEVIQQNLSDLIF